MATLKRTNSKDLKAKFNKANGKEAVETVEEKIEVEGVVVAETTKKAPAKRSKKQKEASEKPEGKSKPKFKKLYYANPYIGLGKKDGDAEMELAKKEKREPKLKEYTAKQVFSEKNTYEWEDIDLAMNNIDEIIGVNNTFSYDKYIVKSEKLNSLDAGLIYVGAELSTMGDLEKLVLLSYAFGGKLQLKDVEIAVSNGEVKRPASFNAKKALSLFIKGEYTVEDVLKLVPGQVDPDDKDSNGEAYYLLLFIENGFNNLGKLAFPKNGRQMKALREYLQIELQVATDDEEGEEK